MTNKFICRGISKETGKFVYGYYYCSDNSHYILNFEKEKLPEFEMKEGIGYPVPQTISISTEITKEPDRWTELFDKNNKNIYEGDILEYKDLDHEINEIHIVKWGGEGDENVGYINKNGDMNVGNVYGYLVGEYNIDDYEVIGNIHFNKDLLKK